MHPFGWVGIAFLGGFLLSPWNGGFLFTIAFIIVVEIAIASFWGWGARRLLIVVASLSGWFIGKTLFVPLMAPTPLKHWVDGRLVALRELLPPKPWAAQ